MGPLRDSQTVRLRTIREGNALDSLVQLTANDDAHHASAAGFRGAVQAWDTGFARTATSAPVAKPLAMELAAIRPGIRVLFLSGYTDADLMRRGVVQHESAYLQKPVTPPELTKKVREVPDE